MHLLIFYQLVSGILHDIDAGIIILYTVACYNICNSILPIYMFVLYTTYNNSCGHSMVVVYIMECVNVYIYIHTSTQSYSVCFYKASYVVMTRVNVEIWHYSTAECTKGTKTMYGSQTSQRPRA